MLVRDTPDTEIPETSDAHPLSASGDFADVLFARRVDATQRTLLDYGITTGDVVAARLSDRGEVLVLVFAARRLGASVSLIDPAKGPVATTRAVRATDAALLVVDRGVDPARTIARGLVAVVATVDHVVHDAAA